MVKFASLARQSIETLSSIPFLMRQRRYRWSLQNEIGQGCAIVANRR